MFLGWAAIRRHGRCCTGCAAQWFVQTESGRGTFVRHPTESDLADAFGHQLLLAVPSPTADQLYEARQAIEVVAAELAAQRATPDSLATLERLLAPRNTPAEELKIV